MENDNRNANDVVHDNPSEEEPGGSESRWSDLPESEPGSWRGWSVPPLFS